MRPRRRTVILRVRFGLILSVFRQILIPLHGRMAVVRARRQGNIILIVVVIVRVGVNALVDGRALNARIEEPIETSLA